MPSRPKKIAVVASGWHFPYQFYDAIARQKLPTGWKIDMFCIAHRTPQQAKEDKKNHVFAGDRAYLDKKLYLSIITESEMNMLGWKYILEPNTIGDWGNSNQWLEKNDYKDYDLILFTHDDNLIVSHKWFNDVIKDEAFADWEVLCNSLGMPEGWVRGSCEFFKPSLIKKMGGKFDLSSNKLTREGQTTSSDNLEELYQWNENQNPFMDFIEREKINVGYMSPSYRVSSYCIEGERGYISNTHGANTEREDAGLNFLKQNGII